MAIGFALLSLFAGLAASANIPITLDIVNGPSSPDGFVRSSVLANGTFPGPIINAQKGDTLIVTVNNHLTDPTMRRSTAMNFDGIFFQTSDVFMEGSPFVEACPIAPNASFTYTIPLIRDQAGTFWYHSQLDIQYIDGLRGALIVRDPEDPHLSLYDVDDDSSILTVADWWHNTSLELLVPYTATGTIPVADTGLVNSKGRFVGGPETPFGVTTVQPGKRTRLRIISMALRGEFTVNIENHNMTIIEVDGVNVEPHTVASIDLLAGQRYSVVLEANQPIGNYWINAPYVGGNAALNPNFNISFSRGILRYAGAPEEDPTGPLVTVPVEPELIEANLVPLINEVPNRGKVADMNMTITLEAITGKAEWTVNNVSYVSPVVPTIMKVIAGDGDTAADFNVTENTFILPKNKVVDFMFPPNDDDDAHPIHLHGNNFWVVKSNSSDVVNFDNPPRRDTAAAGAAGSTFRIDTSLDGPWFFHCHIFWHMHAGLAMVLDVDADNAKNEIHPNTEWERLCPAYDALPADLQ